MRLNQFLASAGLGSRRSCDALIRDGRVTCNGQTVSDLATRVSASDAITCDGRPVRSAARTVILLHKPKGYLCTATDPQERRTIYHLLPSQYASLSYAGRLDQDSEGLMLLSNDGDLIQRITRPACKIQKIYEVVLDKTFEFADADRLRSGIYLEGQKAVIDEIHRLGDNKVKVILTQGIKRQIRLMFLRVGYKVQRLRRVQIGSLKLGELKTGQWRMVTAEEVDRAFPRTEAIPAPAFKKKRSFSSGKRKSGGFSSDGYKKSGDFKSDGYKPKSRGYASSEGRPRSGRDNSFSSRSGGASRGAYSSTRSRRRDVPET